MDIYVYDTSFRLVAIIDSYETFIWTERYSDYGDFELYLPVDSSVINYLKADYYIEMRESNRTMIIEDIQIDTDVDNGPTLKVSGRSLESILDRRIIWKQTSITDKRADEVIKQLLEENIISPEDSSRRIAGFEFVYDEYFNKEYFTGKSDEYKISSVQFTGDSLFDAVKSICDAFNLGFEITMGNLDERDNGAIRFQFKLFNGINRSYTNLDGTEQLLNPHVVFSPDFENLLNSTYLESHRYSKTVTLVAGEGEGADRTMVAVPGGTSYTLLTEQPSDWLTSYTRYHTKSEDKYVFVDGVTVAPTWSANTYYERKLTVGGKDSFVGYNYELLTARPDDWANNYAKYYIKEGAEYNKVAGVLTAPTWSANTYYLRASNLHADAGSGLARRELFTDARDLTSGDLGADSYDAALVERGAEKLAECQVTESFEGSIDSSAEHKYGSSKDVKMGNADYSIGDIVQVENEYGMECRCRVIEFIRSKDGAGSDSYPTFAKI